MIQHFYFYSFLTYSEHIRKCSKLQIMIVFPVRQNYSLVEQKGMVFDILINFWWKYQVYKYINLDEDVKVDENVKIDEKI